MATNALDIATIFQALSTLEDEFLGSGRFWLAHSDRMQKLLMLYVEFKEVVRRIHGLKAKASTNWEELNQWLVSERFEPLFSEFVGIGVVSILDKLIQWLEGNAVLCQIHGADGQDHPGFELEPAGAVVCRVDGFLGQLAKLKTKSQDTLWLYLPYRDEPYREEPLTGLDMVEMAIEIHTAAKERDERYAGVQIPKVDFSIKPDVSFLIGLDTYDRKDDYWVIAQAFQQFKFRMNEEGARARVVTGIAVLRSLRTAPTQLVFDQPFYGWFTQAGVDLPMAVFYADFDSWKEPAGTLDEL